MTAAADSAHQQKSGVSLRQDCITRLWRYVWTSTYAGHRRADLHQGPPEAPRHELHHRARPERWTATPNGLRRQRVSAGSYFPSPLSRSRICTWPNLGSVAFACTIGMIGKPGNP
jgi:hypothetical protein